MSKIFMCILSVTIIGLSIFRSVYREDTPDSHPTIPTDTLLVEPYSPDWDAFIEALIHVESRGDSEAVGTKNDVGVLQITPIMINDANRIIGEPRYDLYDRTDRDKSIEIFNIIQNHYNPDHDLHFALKIWNSKAPVSYHRAVMDEYNRLTTSCQ